MYWSISELSFVLMEWFRVLVPAIPITLGKNAYYVWRSGKKVGLDADILAVFLSDVDFAKKQIVDELPRR